MGAGFNNKFMQSPQRQVAMLSLSKTGGGAPVLSGLCAAFCSIVDVGVGVYEITVNEQRPFTQVVQGHVTLHAAGIATIDKALTDKLKITVKTFEVDGTTPDDLDFDLLVIGCYAIDLLG